MTRNRLQFLLAIGFCFSAVVQAQTFNRTAVSVNGSDANSCAVNSPCRNFTRAISQTTAGGEVIALDSGGYGPFTINKAITVQGAPGVYAGVTATTGVNAIAVSAGLTDVVIIRGLTLNSLAADHGIQMSLAHAVHVENCVINGFSFGIRVTNGQIFISNSVLRGNTTGILLNFNTFGPATRAWITGSRLENNGDGLRSFGANVVTTIRDSVVASNANEGLGVYTGGDGWVSELFIDNCKVAGNDIGIKGFVASGTSAPVVRVARSTITANTNGISATGQSQVLSFGNNHLAGNATNGAFTPPLIAPQ